MATLPNPLPKLAADPAGRCLGLELPAGRLVDATDEGPWHEPLLWCAQDRAVPGDWSAPEPARRAAGLLPVLLDVGGGQGGPEHWELLPGRMSYPGDHDAEEVLADLWDAHAAQDEEWPGLADSPDSTPSSATTPVAGARDAAAPDAFAADFADSLLADGGPLEDPRLALVPARRSADIPAAIGWSGPAHHEDDTARLCAVLRSWEDRFGIRVVALGFAHLLVSVAAPPTALAEAEALAAEHFAFSPDTLAQGTFPRSGTPPLAAYAERHLLGRRAWHFWWD
jgi:hypothetical protein